MAIYFEINEELNLIKELPWTELTQKVLDVVLDHVSCPFECEVNISLTDDKEIHEINLEQRKMDKPTDVLSFPMVVWLDIADFDWVENEVYNFHPDSGELMLGDVIISYDTLLKQAEEYGHSFEREYAFLLVHSLLHLLGHDHMQEGERTVMEEEQRKIMRILNIHR